MIACSGLVAAGSGKWSPVQDWWLLVQEGGRRCRTVVAAAGKWLPVPEGGC